MDPDQLFLDGALTRIHIWMAVLSGAGMLAATIHGGWRWLAGFLLGAGASWINFRWIKQLAHSLGEATAGKRLKARVAVLIGLRYVLLGGAAYAIVNYSTISLAAAFIGLFVPVTAATLEILFELIYART